MIETKKLLNLGDPLVALKEYGDKVSIINNHYTYFQLDKFSFKIDKKAIIEKDASAHQFSKKFDISKNNLQVYPKQHSKNMIFVKDNHRLKIVANLKLDINPSIVKFSHNSKMLLIGSSDGDIWLYDVNLKKIIYTFFPRADEISSIAFSKDDSLVAIGSFDKKILIHDCTNWEVLSTIECESTPEDMVFSFDKKYLYFVQREGEVSSYHVEDQQLKYTKKFNDQWFTLIKTHISDNFALLGTRSNILILFDLKSGKALKNITLQNSGINSIEFDDKNFFATFADGGFLVGEVQKYKDEALVAIKLKDYIKAKELIDKNIFLYLDGTIDKLYECWDEVLKKVIILLELNEIEEATALASAFLDNEEFNVEFSSYMSYKEEIAAFIQSVNTKHYASAYQIANKHEYIKQLKKYQDLEDLWHRSFNRAKKIIEKNPNNSSAIIRAKGAMHDFLNVKSKQEIIDNLLNNSKLFFQAETLVKEKKFSEFFTLCQRYKFLEDTTIYHKVISVSTLLLSNVSKAIANKDYDNALALANRLLGFLPIQDEVQTKIKEIQVIKQFDEALKNQDLLGAFLLIKSNKFLESFLEYSKLMRDFEECNERAKISALEGDVKKVFEILDEYIKIDYLKDQVAFTLRFAYLNSIELALQDSSIDWEKTLINYINMYGKDEDIKNIALKHNVMEIFNKIDYDESQKRKKIKFKEQIVAT